MSSEGWTQNELLQAYQHLRWSPPVWEGHGAVGSASCAAPRDGVGINVNKSVQRVCEPQVTSRGEDLPPLDVQHVGEPQVIRKSGRRPPTVGRSTGG